MKKGKFFLDLITTINDTLSLKKKSVLYVPVIPEIESWKSDLLFLIIRFPRQSSFYNTVFPLVSQTYGYGQKNAFIFRGLGADFVCL